MNVLTTHGVRQGLRNYFLKDVTDKDLFDCPLRAREVAVGSHLPSRSHLLSQSGLRYGCPKDAVFASGNSILRLGGAHADESSAPCYITIAKPEKGFSSGFYCRDWPRLLNSCPCGICSMDDLARKVWSTTCATILGFES
jgi:hypothetical protein